MWTLSGFSDEISPDFTEQCEVVSGLGMKYVEVRSAWDVNILDLSPDQLDTIKKTLSTYGLRVSSIGSPIGKIPVTEDFEPHLERMKHAAEVARLLEAPYIRIFSFFMPAGDDPATHRAEVIERMRALTRVAEEADLVLLHENEKEIYGDVPSRCLDLIRSVGSPYLRLAWDPANFVQVGVRPYTDGYAQLRPHIEYVQIKDALFADNTVVPAGQGDGEVAATMRALRHDGFDGFFSLEPHLAGGHATGGFSGPELFTTAWRAFTGLLDTEEIEYA
ncbi:sugar phosphate isomerase/epimerase [Actinoplanes sp. LDG1-06]|uniref:Sugar phosphate isomerase/epimerase n=1 Tax=Paractinoplanes ovalisporus TaxID=2810368 RepID=A0ABS2A4W3_9ACTN|nr:sugar phosphate isomerase/epimerase family protein [Actinoplanes ovalisporus]MBM2614333.1 sugar phosphate isomerase/epimerase [Actinoplanes ovalisporus]